MQMIFSLMLIYLSVHSLVNAFNLSSWVILHKCWVFLFQFLLSCFRVFNIFRAFISIIIILFFKINFKKKKKINSLFVLINSFYDSVYIIALNLVWIALETSEGVSHRRFFSLLYCNSLFSMNLPLDAFSA